MTNRLFDKWKVILFYILSLLVLFALAEMILRIRGNEPWKLKHLDRIVKPCGQYYEKHPLLGYTLLPGEFDITIVKRNNTFHVSHKENNQRITHEPNNKKRVKGEIWIFGCSYTYGWAVNNEETYPWLIQEELEDYEILNFGVSGYGTIHSLIQLKEALKKLEKPKLVILSYSCMHDQRNTYERRWAKNIAPYNNLKSLVRPYARFNGNKKAICNYSVMDYKPFPFAGKSAFINWLEGKFNIIESNFFRSHDVSKALIEEIYRICNDNNIDFIIAGLDNDPSTRDMLFYCSKKGMKILDISIPSYSWEKNAFYDGHPSPAQHRLYADKLIDFVKKILK